MSSSDAQPSTIRHVDFRSGQRPWGASGVRVRESRSGPWLVLRIEGEMDLQVDPLVARIGLRGCSFVVFELHGVTFIDGSGLRVLAETRRRAVASSGGVRLVAPSACVRRLLLLAGAAVKFPVFDTVHQALSKPLERAGHAS